MTPLLDSYLQEELTRVQNLMDEFRSQYADADGLAPRGGDPHVELLIKAVAALTLESGSSCTTTSPS